MFVVTVTVDDETSYLAIDDQSGGYPYWSDSISRAKIHHSFDEANKWLDSPDFTKDNVMSDGGVFPPSMIHSGLRLNYAKKSGTGVISIKKITFENKLVKYIGAIVKLGKPYSI